MDIVYLVKDCLVNEELVYSLRSLANLPHNKVFMVGGCPNSLDKSKVVCRPFLQTKDKHTNTTANLKRICEEPELSEDFILMNDDFFVIKPIKDPEKELNLYRGTVADVLKEYARYGNGSNYANGMKQTMIYLQEVMGIKEPLSYELHIPMVINKTKFLKMFELPHLRSVKVLHKRTLYGNLYLKDSVLSSDVKVLRNIYRPITQDKFLSSEDNSFDVVKRYLDTLDLPKSPYEL